MEEHRSVDSQRLYHWMLEHLHEALKGAHFLIAAAICGVAFLLYTGTGLASVLIWAAYLLTCQALLGASMLASLPRHRWIQGYAAAHLLACAGWGLLPVLFFAQLSPAYQSLYALLVAAAAVVSMPTLSYLPRLYLIGAALMLLPVAAMLAWPPGGEQYTTSLGLAFFLVVGLVLLGFRVSHQHGMLRQQAVEMLSLERARSALREHQSRLKAERRRAEQAGKWDPVTGTRSQAGFLEELESQVRDNGAAVVCVRVAGFKYVNMAFGHDIGDEVLREMAARIVRLAGESSRVSRTGGGEFLAFFEAPVAELRDELSRLCDGPCLTSRGPVMMNAYIGMSVLDAGENHLEGLYGALHAAEQAKEEGDKAVRTLAAADRNTQRYRSLMRFELCEALDRNEFHLVFQPQHRLHDRALVGFEALLRWDSKAFGPVSPAEFIPVAEEADLIVEVGTWVVRNAISEFHRRFEPDNLALSLNISLAQLQAGNFVDVIKGALHDSGLPAKKLVLEITESTFMASPEIIGERLQALRDIGVQVSLDDFGTGYSSLSYLTRIPLDEVKIDRAFVMGMSENEVSRTLVTSLLHICQALDLRAVMEGVETPQQLNALAGFDDVIIQGFLFSRPMRIGEASGYATGFRQLA